jgi:hypothetical protein
MGRLMDRTFYATPTNLPYYFYPKNIFHRFHLTTGFKFFQTPLSTSMLNAKSTETLNTPKRVTSLPLVKCDKVTNMENSVAGKYNNPTTSITQNMTVAITASITIILPLSLL